jgi:outer membrane lipoprotein-sorting protein
VGLAGCGVVAILAVKARLGTGAQHPKQQPSNPVGGPAWNTKTSQEPQIAGLTLDPKQLETVKRVSAYFNDLLTLRGTFVQTTSDNKRMRGKFFVKKPGRFRFDYAPPSLQIVMSDGRFLRIYDQDLDLGTDDRRSLDETLFRILLKKDVDLVRDARILDLQESDDLIVLQIQDKGPESSGRIKLFMAKGTALELKEWVTNDAQGETRVELAGLVKGEDLDVGLFKIESPSIKKPGQ